MTSVFLFHSLFWIAYPLVLAFTVLFGLPAFVVFFKLKKLEWWYAVLVGVSTSLIYCLLNTHDIDYLASKNNLLFMAMGIGLSIVFWWVGVFRNPKFDFVSISLPRAQLLLVPIFAIGIYSQSKLDIEHYRGRVLAIDFNNPYPIKSDKCTVDVRLSTGENIMSDFWGCDWPMSNVINKCFHLDNRWSTLRFKRVYSVSSLLGGDSDEC